MSPSTRSRAGRPAAPAAAIRIRGARQNNLKDLSLTIPLGKLIVITGVSGSGKSSLAFDTIYSEGQRRYVETFSAYTRQFLDRMDKPRVDRIEGIPPAIAIDQTNPVRTSRSTVGTMTELNDHLKLLFARASRLFCGKCGREVRRDSPESIASRLPPGRQLLITFPVTVVPGFRPDAAMGIENPKAYNRWLNKLGPAAGLGVRDWGRLLEALRRRIDAFAERGCRLSDHGIEEPYAAEYTESEVKRIFSAARKGSAPTAEEALKYKSALLVELGRMYAERKWAWQLHLGALRNVNSRALERLGPNTGYDTIGDFPMARGLAALLDRLDADDRLPRTVLFSLNPVDNAVLAAMTGCFQDGLTPGKIQHGAAWWFNDQKPGMEEHLKSLASLGLLPRFIGMLTDSRSFLSFPRHEYFRRILCNLLGGWIESGELPRDWGLVGGVVRDICWNNAEAYFGIPRKAAVLTES